MYKTPEEIAQESESMNFDMAREQMMQRAEAQDAMPPETTEVPVEQTEAPVEEVTPTEEVVPQESATPPQDEGLALAEIATQELQSVKQQLAESQAQIEQLSGLVQQQSQQVAENIVEPMMVEKPTLDMNIIMYGSEDEISSEQSRYADAITNHAKSEVMKEVSPYIEDAKMAKMDSVKRNTLDSLAQSPELQGFADLIPQMEHIISRSPSLTNEQNLEQRYINAYLIARGANAMSAPPPQAQQPQTVEQMFEMYKSNPELQSLIEKERIGVLEKGQQVPLHSASDGAVNVALNIPKRPTTIAEASSEAEKRFANMKR